MVEFNEGQVLNISNSYIKAYLNANQWQNVY
jgi:hypothetical protein